MIWRIDLDCKSAKTVIGSIVRGINSFWTFADLIMSVTIGWLIEGMMDLILILLQKLIRGILGTG